MDYNRKKRQMLFHEEAVHAMKMKFNEKFFALRDVRADIVKTVVAGAKRVREITDELNDGDSPEAVEALAAIEGHFVATPLAEVVGNRRFDAVFLDLGGVGSPHLVGAELVAVQRLNARAAPRIVPTRSRRVGGGVGRDARCVLPVPADRLHLKPLVDAWVECAGARRPALNPTPRRCRVPEKVGIIQHEDALSVARQHPVRLRLVLV